MRLRIFSFDFIIEYSFLLVLSFGIVTGTRDIEYLLLYSSLHELGHIALLLALGGKIKSLTFSFYGLALKYEQTISMCREIIVILSGPLVNLILYLIFHDDINLIILVLNLLPVYPLDGGRVLRLLLPKASRAVSLITLVLVTAFSFYLIVFYHSFSLIFIAAYLLAYSILY